MNPFQILSVQPSVTRLGSTLLHFVWQGLVIAAVYAAARRLAAKSSPNLRYALGCAALAIMAAAPMVTWALLGPAAPQAAILAPPVIPAATSGEVRIMPSPVFMGLPAQLATPFLSWVVAIWLVGAMALWVRLTGGWILAVRLRSRLVQPASAAWQETLDRLRARMRVSRAVTMLLSPLVQAPSVVGWLRPVVLTPVGAIAGLSTEQMEALLLHELAHIRRYDYLINMLQSAVEALLFYHPAVWWVSGHMRTERELCCDDAAVTEVGDAVVYARALAKLGSLCPPVVMAANGGSLANRIGRLLGKPQSATRALPGAGIVAAAVLPVIAAVTLFGQSDARPKFDVASIRPAGDEGPIMMRPQPGGFIGTLTVRGMMQSAFSAQSFQIIGGPDWINSQRYAMDAKGPGNPSMDVVRLMMQSLLEERFQLKVHRETRDLPVYNLVVARGGPRLPAPQDGGCDPSENPPPLLTGGRMAPPGGGQPLSRCGGVSTMLQPGGARMYGGKIAMPELVRVLSMVLGRTVIDKTGYTGLFDVQLDFLPDERTPMLPPPPPDVAASSEMSPTIFNALTQQLGLRLETASGPVQVMVIDHVERPGAN